MLICIYIYIYICGRGVTGAAQGWDQQVFNEEVLYASHGEVSRAQASGTSCTLSPQLPHVIYSCSFGQEYRLARLRPDPVKWAI
jgi:hypothetical protein